MVPEWLISSSVLRTASRKVSTQDRALQMIEDMIAEGSLSDIHYEWGNMTARVTLDAGPPDDSQQALEEFRENYSMTELD